MAGQCFFGKEGIKMTSYGVNVIDALYTITTVYGRCWLVQVQLSCYGKKLERNVCQCEAAVWGLEVLISA